MDSLATAQDSVMERLEKSGVQGECAIIASEFSVADLDGLKHD